MESDLIVWKVALMLLEADVQEEREAERIVVHDAYELFRFANG